MTRDGVGYLAGTAIDEHRVTAAFAQELTTLRAQVTGRIAECASRADAKGLANDLPAAEAGCPLPARDWPRARARRPQ